MVSNGNPRILIDPVVHPPIASRVVNVLVLLFVVSIPLVCWAIEIFGIALTASHLLGLALLLVSAGVWWKSRRVLPLNLVTFSAAAFFVLSAFTVALVQLHPDIEVLGESAHTKSIKQLVGLGFGLAVFMALYCLLQWYGLGLAVLRAHYWTTFGVAVLTFLQFGVAMADMTSPFANFSVHNSTLGVQRALSLMYGFPRVSLTMVEPSNLAAYLLTGWAFWLYTADRPTFVSDGARPLFVASGVVLGAAIVITGSRLAYIIFAVLVIVALAWRPRRLRRAALVGASVLVGFVLIGPENSRALLAPLAPFLMTSESAVVRDDASTQHRAASYLVAKRALEERPLLGTGLGTSAFYMERYWSSFFTPLAAGRSVPHTMLSQYATVVTETGLAGLLCLAVFTFGVLRRLWLLSRYSGTANALAWGIGGSVASYYIAGLATAFVVYQILLVWLVLALALTVGSSPEIRKTG